MAIAGVMIANIFTGFSATAWTAWLFFATFIGIIIVWIFTVRDVLISLFIEPSSDSHFIDHLFPHFARIRRHITLRKLLPALHVSVLLALPAPHVLPCTRTALCRKSLEARVRAK